MDRNALALLTNELGGYDEVERVLGVDAELVRRAILGLQLTRLEQAEIETAFNQLFIEPEIAEDEFLDLDELFGRDEKDKGLTGLVDDVQGSFYDVDRENLFRQAFAENRIDIDDLERAERLFKDGYATPQIQDRILDWLGESRYNEETFNSWVNANGRRRSAYRNWLRDNQAQRFGLDFTDYLQNRKYANRTYNKWFGNDRTAKEFLDAFTADGEMLKSESLLDSYFWEWYRETFY